MTVAELLLDMKAAHAARTQYAKASERLAEKAIRLRQANDPDCRTYAGWANTVRRWGAKETM